ncbi:MAG: FecR domain-containing protein [Myxococcaceae bacterium]
MVSHDSAGLWRYASSELEYADVAMLEEHLTGCPECRDELDFIRATRLTLRAATAAAPRIEWDKVDDALGAAVAKKMMRPGLGQWFRPVLVGALALPVALGIVAVLGFLQPEVAPLPAVAAAVTLTEPARASLVTGTTVRAAGGERALQQGERLAAGDRLRTAPRGLAVVELPDHSRVRLAPSSELMLVRAKENEIALTLGQGRLAALAAHAPSRPFVVDAGGLVVRVVGTAFTVSSTRTHVEVAVAEGTVLIEPGLGQTMLLTAGKRARFERAGWKVRQGAISAEQRAELAELGMAPAPAERANEPARKAPGGNLGGAAAGAGSVRAVPAGPSTGVPAVGSASGAVGSPVADAPPVVGAPAALSTLPGNAPASGGAPAPLGFLPDGEPARRDPLDGAPDQQPPATSAELDAMDIRPAPLVSPAPLANEPSQAGEEWSSFPPVRGQPAAPSRLQSPEGDSLPRDLEGLFLRRAEEALVSGRCDRYELGLGELTETSESPLAREKARILKARCYDATLRPADAAREYRRYLRDWPAGRWADEAHGATEER